MGKWVWVVGLVACFSAVGFAAGAEFPGEKCGFEYWPQGGWVVAPPAQADGGRRLLRASHEPRLGLAIEAWVGPLASVRDGEAAGAEEQQRSALEERGWQVGRVDYAPVGAYRAVRARAHRRAAGQVFVLDEYQFDAAGRRFTLRVTGRGVGVLQDPVIGRWLDSFRLL